ncbi:MAG: winged helix DNA-binding protein [Candidatus Bathyarchaeia archaeon]
MSSKFSSIPDEIYLLCILHNIGATEPSRALTIEEIARWTAMDQSKAEQSLNKLMESKYIEVMEVMGARKYFVSIDGIRKVLSMYS